MDGGFEGESVVSSAIPMCSYPDDDLVGSFERMQLPMPEPSSKDYGQYLRAQRARQLQQQQQQQQACLY